MQRKENTHAVKLWLLQLLAAKLNLLVFAFAICIVVTETVFSQQRSIEGWQPAPPAEETSQSAGVSAHDKRSAVQQAAYKPQQTGGLPSFPTANVSPPQMPSAGQSSASQQSPNLLPPQEFNSPAANPPMPVTSAAAVDQTPSRIAPSEVFGPSSGIRPQTNAATTAASTGVRTKGNQPAPPQAGIRNVSQQSNQPSAIMPEQGQLTPRQRGAQIASGLPYVTPRPNRLGGRYPTAPYSGPRYQPAGYQRPLGIQVPQKQAAQTQRTIPARTVAATQTGGVLPQAQPQFSNNPNITPTAYQQCLPQPALPPAAGVYVPPTVTPNMAPGVYSGNNSGYAPLFSLGQENYNVQLGRGIIGQPTVYVPGQPVRNFLRYLAP